MNCKACEYPLWNIAARQCPECGAPFKPSDFEFALNSVRFCCPHCRQAYYGTGDKGQLVPRAFACVNCARAVDMDEMVLLPTEGVAESMTRVEEHPWMARKRTGRFRAFFRTMSMAMANPARLMELTPENRPASEALWYGVVTNAIFLTTGLTVFWMGSAAPAALGVRGGSAALVFLLGAAASLVVVPLAWMLFWGVLTHIILLLTGGTTAGISRTMQAIGYSAGTNVLTGVPCIGPVLSPVLGVWWAITAGMVLRAGHKCSGWRAALAIGVPPALLIAAGLGLLVLTQSTRSAGWTKFGKSSTTVTTAPAGGNIATVGKALTDFASENDDSWPTHGAVLLTRAGVLPSHMLAPNSQTTMLVPDGPIEKVAALNGEQMMAMAEQLAARLPEGVIAHRVGDTVFTYHGVGTDDPRASALWIAMQAPQGNSAPQIVQIADVSGAFRMVIGQVWAKSLAEQNALRANFGLAPLPDPWTVTLEAPAVAPARK